MDSNLDLLDRARLTDSIIVELDWGLFRPVVSAPDPETSVGYSGIPKYCVVIAVRS